MGSSDKIYTVHEGLIDKYPSLSQRVRSLYSEWGSGPITLPEIHEDIGHTLVHYVYTGQYQLFRLAPNEPLKEKINDFRRSVLAYCAARLYGISGLETAAKANAECFGHGLSISDVKVIAEAVFTNLPPDDVWFSGYLQEKVNAAFQEDDTLITEEKWILENIGRVSIFDRVVVKSIIAMYLAKCLDGKLEAEKVEEKHINQPTAEPEVIKEAEEEYANDYIVLQK
jgi:hypothetical protein